MLVMAVVLMIRALPCSWQGGRDVRGIMPHQGLKQLIPPSDTYLVSLVDMIPFRFRNSRSGDAEKQH